MCKVLLLRVAVAALVLATIVFAGGCWNPFAPPDNKPPDIPPAQYRERTSPENVIHNLNTSYVWRNADEYLECLADSFVFHLNPDDVGNPQNPLPEYWGKDEEETIHRNMFAEGSDVVSISLTLTTSFIDFVPGPLPGSADDRWLYHDQVDLRVTVVDTLEDLTYHATAPVEFLFQIDPGQVGTHGETLWEIIHWWDLRSANRAPVAPDLDELAVTFGELKAMYRD
jgi:hypothetical protein